VKQARGYIERALTVDPTNVEALVGIAGIDAAMSGAFMADDRAARLAAAEAALTKALSLAPNHASAHSVLGYVQILTNRAAQGIAECERALALDRNLAHAHGYIGIGKYFIGRGAETEAHIQEALRLSPRDNGAYAWMVYVGGVKLALGADEEAVSWLRRAIETNRNLPTGHFFLAAALAQLGQIDEACAAMRGGLSLDPTYTIRRYRDGASSDNPTYLAQRERVYDGMRKAGLPEG
jgi:tetratricopeptide (TPR) repeat protein